MSEFVIALGIVATAGFYGLVLYWVLGKGEAASGSAGDEGDRSAGFSD